MPGPRRKARIAALQALYESDLTGHPVDRALESVLTEQSLDDNATRFAKELVQGVEDNLQRIDAVISKYATAFPLNQVSVVDRNVLRLAIYEALIDNRTLARIAANEAVELGKLFGSDSSARFINGVLGAALREHRVGDEGGAGSKG